MTTANNTNTTTWDYKGTTITILNNGTFSARKDGHVVTTPSLDAMKKKLDQMSTFVPFTAYFELSGYQAERALGKNPETEVAARFERSEK